MDTKVYELDLTGDRDNYYVFAENTKKALEFLTEEFEVSFLLGGFDVDIEEAEIKELNEDQQKDTIVGVNFITQEEKAISLYDLLQNHQDFEGVVSTNMF